MWLKYGCYFVFQKELLKMSYIIHVEQLCCKIMLRKNTTVFSNVF